MFGEITALTAHPGPHRLARRHTDRRFNLINLPDWSRTERARIDEALGQLAGWKSWRLQGVPRSC